EKGANDSYVLLSPCGIDGAETGIFPHAVEEAAMGLREREDVARLEGRVHALGRGEVPCLFDGRGRPVEAPDALAPAGEEPGVVAAARARHGDARGPSRRERRKGAALVEPG